MLINIYMQLHTIIGLLFRGLSNYGSAKLCNLWKIDVEWSWCDEISSKNRKRVENAATNCIYAGVVQAYESNYENWWRIPEKAAAFHHGGLPYADSPRLICDILNIAFISLKSWENRIILPFVTNSSTNLRIVQDWFIMLTLFLWQTSIRRMNFISYKFETTS